MDIHRLLSRRILAPSRHPYPYGSLLAKGSGQSLVEMVLIMPLLLMVLLGGVSFGLGLYQANLASSAIQQPALKKLDMANNPNAIPVTTVLGWVTGADTAKGSMNLKNPAIDEVAFASSANLNTSVIVGTKKYQPLLNFIPTMNITVAQGINKNLLLAANGGAKIVRPADKPWVPGGAPKQPVWDKFKDANLPPDLAFNPGCALSDVGDEQMINAVSVDTKTDKTYISLKPVAAFSAVTRPSLIQMAQSFAGGCASAGAGICAKEQEDLMPNPPSDQEAAGGYDGGLTRFGSPPDPVNYKYKIINPPGGPGMILTYAFTCQGPPDAKRYCSYPEPVINKNPAFGPDHGMYYDESGDYKQPPPDFVSSCMARKQAECMLQKAADQANSVLNQFPDACQ